MTCPAGGPSPQGEEFLQEPAEVVESAEKTLVWRGCGISKVAFVEKAARQFSRETGISIRLSGGGAALGIQATAEGGADFGGSCRECLAKNGESQWNLKLTMVAWDALAVVVHPDNPLDSMTKEQLVAVLQQEVSNWRELGGEDQPIVALARKGKVSGVGYMARLLIFGDPEADFGPRVIRLPSSGPLEKSCERIPNAVAITGVSSARRRNLKILAVDGILPTPQNIAAGRYPFFRPLYLVHRPTPSPEVQQFLDWILSESGQKVVQEAGSVTLQQGLGLMGKYCHFDDKSRIQNFQELELQWKASLQK